MPVRICTVLAVGLLMTVALNAGPGNGKQNNGKGNPKTKHAAASGFSTTIDVDIILGEYRRIVRDYIEHPPNGSLPPGLAKRGGALPPGLAKQLRRNGTLSPGLQKRLAPYPADLARRLPQLGDDYDGGFLHGRVVVFNKRTSAILEVFIP